MIYKAIAFSVAIVSTIAGLFFGGYYVGRSNGIDKYHRMCYDIGGIVVDKKSKTVVLCQKAGVIQEHELDRLDKD